MGVVGGHVEHFGANALHDLIHAVYLLSAVDAPRYVVEARRITIVRSLRAFAARFHDPDRMDSQWRLQVPIEAPFTFSLKPIPEGRKDSVVKGKHFFGVTNRKVEVMNLAAVDRRIQLMARTHELLSQSHWRGVSLVEIVQREFAPYAANNVEIDGPSVTLRAEAAQSVAMVLHELTTNAAKYGAFSDRNGRVLLGWRWLSDGSGGGLAIEWREIGGPPVTTPNRSGYGTSVISELVPFELGGKVDLAFAPDGVTCRIELPAEWVGNGDRKELHTN